MSVEETLQALKPVSAIPVYDVLKSFGFDVNDWHYRKDGMPLANPRKNSYRNNHWAYGRHDKNAALVLWHRYMTVRDDEIVYERKFYPDVTNGNKQKHAVEYAQMLSRLAMTGRMFRVIIVDGDIVPDEKLAERSSSASERSGDSNWWYVKSYDEVRKEYILARSNDIAIRLAVLPKVFVYDIFEQGNESVLAAYATALRLNRDPKVSAYTKTRAENVCEYCQHPAFVSAKGVPFVESHHIIFLSNDGQDHICNTAALCPNCHREAHHGQQPMQLAIKQHLTAIRKRDCR